MKLILADFLVCFPQIPENSYLSRSHQVVPSIFYFPIHITDTLSLNSSLLKKYWNIQCLWSFSVNFGLCFNPKGSLNSRLDAYGRFDMLTAQMYRQPFLDYSTKLSNQCDSVWILSLSGCTVWCQGLQRSRRQSDCYLNTCQDWLWRSMDNLY